MNKYFKTALLLLVILLSLFLKLKDIDEFKTPANFITTHDGFRFARYAMEIINNAYTKIDYLADVPHLGINQYPPPLLSLMAVWFSKLSGVDINYMFLLLPSLLSVLFVVPLYLWLKPTKDYLALLGGVTLGMFNFHYFGRTRLGYFDTDCLMLFFVFTVLWLLQMSLAERDRRHLAYLYVVLAGFTMAIFRWWYDHAFFGLIVLAGFAIGLITYSHSLRECFFRLLLFMGLLNPIELTHYLMNSPFIKDYFYGVVMGAEGYKNTINIYASIAEIQPVSLSNMVFFTTGNPLTFLIGIVFFIVFFYKNFRYLSVAIPIILIGFSAPYTGFRYLIFASPFIGIGIGYGLGVMLSFLRRKFSINEILFSTIGAFLVIFFCFPPEMLHFDTKPFFERRQVENFQTVKDITESNAYIVSWWEYGNAIQYYSDRATFMDNTYFHPLKAYLILKALTSEDEGFAYRVIRFMSHTRGLTDASVNEFLNKREDITKLEVQPIYVLVYDKILPRVILKDNRLSKEENVELIKRLPLTSFHCDLNKYKEADCSGFVLNLNNDDITINDNLIKRGYRKIIYVNKISRVKKEFHLNERSNQIITVVLSKDGRIRYTISHEDFQKTLLYRMMVLSEDNFTYFKIAREDYPYMVLYGLR